MEHNNHRCSSQEIIGRNSSMIWSIIFCQAFIYIYIYIYCKDPWFGPPICEQLIGAQQAQHNIFIKKWILQERMFQQIKYGP